MVGLVRRVRRHLRDGEVCRVDRLHALLARDAHANLRRRGGGLGYEGESSRSRRWLF